MVMKRVATANIIWFDGTCTVYGFGIFRDLSESIQVSEKLHLCVYENKIKYYCIIRFMQRFISR